MPIDDSLDARNRPRRTRLPDRKPAEEVDALFDEYVADLLERYPDPIMWTADFHPSPTDYADTEAPRIFSAAVSNVRLAMAKRRLALLPLVMVVHFTNRAEPIEYFITAEEKQQILAQIHRGAAGISFADSGGFFHLIQMHGIAAMRFSPEDRA